MKRILLGFTFLMSCFLLNAQPESNRPTVKTASGILRGVSEGEDRVSKVSLMQHHQSVNIAGVHHSL